MVLELSLDHSTLKPLPVSDTYQCSSAGVVRVGGWGVRGGGGGERERNLQNPNPSCQLATFSVSAATSSPLSPSSAEPLSVTMETVPASLENRPHTPKINPPLSLVLLLLSALASLLSFAPSSSSSLQTSVAVRDERKNSKKVIKNVETYVIDKYLNCADISEGEKM